MATMLERNKKTKAPQKTRAEHMEDALYREVWEDVNNEKTVQFIKKYSKHMMVGALIILIIATGFQIGMRTYRANKIATAAAYEMAIENTDANALAALADDASGATADLALFQSYLLDNDINKLLEDLKQLIETMYKNNNPDNFASKGFVVFAIPLLMVLLQTFCCFINDVFYFILQGNFPIKYLFSKTIRVLF